MPAQDSAQPPPSGQQYRLTDVDDLTLFADEAFSTDDVDLLEVGGGEESPLARLKSIVLSLDWEISDSNLRELGDEARHLRQVLHDNALADVYLQGLDKLSRYVQAAQSDTHPNAIKLLQIYYCNLEKLCAAPEPWPEEIPAMVREDVRRFGILTSQVGGSGVAPASSLEGLRDLDGLAVSHLQRLKALVLGIDWEVTEGVLDELEQEVGQLQAEGLGGAMAALLLQGVGVLARYMRQAGSQTHASAFSLLYAMYNGIEYLTAHPELPIEEAQALVLDLGGRFEGLKALVAGHPVQEAPALGPVEEPDVPGASAVAASLPAAGVVAAALPAAVLASGALRAADQSATLSLELDEDDDLLPDDGAVQAPALAAFVAPEEESVALPPTPPESLVLELDGRLEEFFGPSAASAETLLPETAIVPLTDTEEMPGVMPLDLEDASLQDAAMGDQALAEEGPPGILFRDEEPSLTALSEVPPPSAEAALQAEAPFEQMADTGNDLALNLEEQLDTLFSDAAPPALSEALPPSADAAVHAGAPMDSQDEGVEVLQLELAEQLDAFFGDSEVVAADLPGAAAEVEASLSAPAMPGDDAPSPQPAGSELQLALEDRLDAFFAPEPDAVPAADEGGPASEGLPAEDVDADELEMLALDFETVAADGLEAAEAPLFAPDGLEGLAADLALLREPPTEDLLQRWRAVAEEEISRLADGDPRRTPLCLLDTILALPCERASDADGTALLAAIGQSLVQGKDGRMAQGGDDLLVRYLVWQKQINRALIEPRQNASSP